MTWTNDEELQPSIRRGIREGFDLVRGTRGSLCEDQERVIADAVVKHLEKGDWRVERGPPAEGASGLIGKQGDNHADSNSVTVLDRLVNSVVVHGILTHSKKQTLMWRTKSYCAI
jgi:hypothetical protein